MDLYTLTKQFFPQHNIDRFFSLIWTERYYSAGDFQVVLPVIPYLIQQLAPGTLIGLRGVKGIMVVDTLVIANDTITVTGGDLVQFLNQRVAWFEDPGYDGSGDNSDGSSQPRSSGVKFADYSDNTQTAGEFISGVVKSMVIDPDPFDVPFMSINLDWNDEVISNLSLGNIDHTGGNQDLSFPIGQLYDSLVQIAQAQNVGFRLYLSSADYDTGDYSLKFSTYRGKDRTSDQTDRDLLRFSADLDNFTGTTETYSNTDSKNVAYVTFQNVVSVHYPSWVDPDNPPKNFSRRVIRVDAPDIHLVAGDGKIDRFRARVAANTFRHQRDLTTVDGQVLEVPGQYRYPQDYFLGDLVELEGKSGLIVKATVAEYIRSEDQYGIKEYPTFQILGPTDPVFVGDPDYVPENGTPTFTGNPPVDVPDAPPTFEDIPLTPTTPFEVPDWEYETDIGYYTHMGTMYIVGSVTADGDPKTGSATLFTGIPATLRPTSSVSTKVMVDHGNSTYEYACDSGLTIGPYLDVTVNTDGTVTLDSGNPFRAVDENKDSTELSLLLSSISWATSHTVDDSPADTGSLDDYVAKEARINTIRGSGSATDDAWTNVDGSYAVHTGRFHLRGKIKAAALANDFPPLLLPSTAWPKLSTEHPGLRWCEVPTPDGYRGLAYVDGDNLTLAGVQKPPTGNNGCGWWQSVFYSRNSDGFLGRGSSPTLSFTPGIPDAGLSFIGCSGYPIEDFPSIADWRGSSYTGKINSIKTDLIDVASLVEFGGTFAATDLCQGPDQFCVVMGIADDMASYYKLVFTYNSTDHNCYMFLFFVPCAGDAIELGWNNAHAFTETDGSATITWTVRLSTAWEDAALSSDPGAPNYYQMLPPFSGSLVHGSSFSYETSAPASPGGKGHMGIHLPSGLSGNIVNAEIDGMGSFPNYAPDDVIDFDGCGWPLL